MDAATIAGLLDDRSEGIEARYSGSYRPVLSITQETAHFALRKDYFTRANN